MIRLGLFSIIITCLLITAPLCSAKETGENPSISPWLYKKLTKTEKLIANKSYTEAGQQLNKMLADVDKGSYEEATVLRSLSSVYALQGKYAKAAQMLSKALALNVLPGKQEQQALLNLGQLYMATDQYQKAVAVLEPWLAKNPESDPEIVILLANAYTQLKQYRKALPYVQKAIKLSKKPVESWYQLNLAIYYEMQQYKPAASLLEQMMRYFPDKKDYWDQAASIYQQLKQYQKAASIKQLAYIKGFLTSEKEILQLANLLSYIDMPYQSATLLAKELKKRRVTGSSNNWKLLADTWTQAREYDLAVAALQKASSLNAKGQLFQQLGRIYVEQEKWTEAVTALNKAMAKGGLNQPGEAYLLLGMAHHELKQNQAARNAFLKAQKYSQSRKAANQWLIFIANDSTANYS